MTQHDPEAWLQLARQALEPREADQARVLSALHERLHLPHASGPTPPPPVDGSRSLHAAPPGVRASGVFPSWTLGIAVPLAGLVAVGAFLAVRHVTPEPRQVPTVSRTITPPAYERPLAQLEDQGHREDQEQRAQEDRESTGDEPKTPTPPQKKRQRKKCRTAQGSERPCTSDTPSETALAGAAPAMEVPGKSSLSEELRALRDAQQALREGRASDALAVLTSFEQRLPGGGAMREEREAAATMARCALTGGAEPKQHYESFVERYPMSAYTTRVAHACRIGLGPRRDAH